MFMVLTRSRAHVCARTHGTSAPRKTSFGSESLWIGSESLRLRAELWLRPEDSVRKRAERGTKQKGGLVSNFEQSSLQKRTCTGSALQAELLIEQADVIRRAFQETEQIQR